MQIEFTGRFLYLYSGREFQCRDPNMNDIGEKDPFSKVHCIAVDAVTCVEIDHSEFTVKLFVKGHPYPLHCSFGSRNCYKINCFGAFLETLQQALHLDPKMIWDLRKRNEQTALSVQRKDEMEIE
jgi:hypothetical protein